MTEWNENDWDPERERKDAQKRVGAMGMEWPSFQGLLRYEWALWEARLAGYCRLREMRDGVTVHDWAKQKLRSSWRRLLVEKYGAHELDGDVALQPMTDDELRGIKERVDREFQLTKAGGRSLNAQETAVAASDAIRAMGIRVAP